MPSHQTSYTIKLTDTQIEKLSSIVEDGTWEVGETPHAYWKAKKNNVSLTAYLSGKLTIQGKGTPEFIEFILEPEVTGIIPELSISSQKDIPVSETNSLPLPHAGIDESGKGDFFGPLVIAAVFVEEDMENYLLDAGVKDSKNIKNEKKIDSIAENIRKIVKGKFSVVPIGPEAYNRFYENIRNLNKLVAWGHARVIENLLERAPECKVALSDKFGHDSLIHNALMKNGKKITLHQRTKGESDIAVAAASILARSEFVRRLKTLGEPLGFDLPKGASTKVEETAKEIVITHGKEILPTIAKMHFKTIGKVMDSIDSGI